MERRELGLTTQPPHQRTFRTGHKRFFFLFFFYYDFLTDSQGCQKFVRFEGATVSLAIEISAVMMLLRYEL